MSANYRNSIISGYLNQQKVATGIPTLISEIIEKIKKFNVRMKREQTEAKHQLNRKSQVQRQIHQDTIGQMTVEQKLKFRIYQI